MRPAAINIDKIYIIESIDHTHILAQVDKLEKNAALQDGDKHLQDGDKHLQDGQSPTGRAEPYRTVTSTYRTGRALQNAALQDGQSPIGEGCI